ncbi:hypothetical protein F4808DRAFT_96128 [Astrocystis sublimbata]|nr:hypothetical protein F4808DRAFT_96128 [Astrocystis sublimbata]
MRLLQLAVDKYPLHLQPVSIISQTFIHIIMIMILGRRQDAAGCPTARDSLDGLSSLRPRAHVPRNGNFASSATSQHLYPIFVHICASISIPYPLGFRLIQTWAMTVVRTNIDMIWHGMAWHSISLLYSRRQRTNGYGLIIKPNPACPRRSWKPISWRTGVEMTVRAPSRAIIPVLCITVLTTKKQMASS